MTEQIGNYYSLRSQTTIGDIVISGCVLSLGIAAGLDNTARACRLSIQDLPGDIKAAAVKGAELEFAWIFDDGDAQNVFTGKIAQAKSPDNEKVDIIGFDIWNTALVKRFTTTIAKQTPSAMIESLVTARLGAPIGTIATTSTLLDKLPLMNQTVAQAIKAINHRMRLDYDAYIDEGGSFVWGPRDYTQEPAFEFDYGHNVLDFDPENKIITTWACPVRLRQVVRYWNHDGEQSDFMVIGIQHLDLSTGTETKIYYEEIPE